MLRSLSIHNFVVVDRLDLEFGPGFTVLTGETGAGKSVLLDALDLLLGERFDPASVRAGAERAELAAEFSIDELPALERWLQAHDLAGEPGVLLVRRVLESGGRSRAYVNGHPATLLQLREAAGSLIDIHGQHAHQSLLGSEAQRELIDSFAGLGTLAREVSAAWTRWRDARDARERAASEGVALAAERELLTARRDELARLDTSEAEWDELSRKQRRLANAASLLAAAEGAERLLTDDEAGVLGRLAAMLGRLRTAVRDDPLLDEAVRLIEPAEIQLQEAARLLRGYRQRADLDPSEQGDVEQRLSALHDAARKYRVRPEQLAELAASTAARLAEIDAAADDGALARAEAAAGAALERLVAELSAGRRAAAAELARRATEALRTLAMPGGALAVALEPTPTPTRHGGETVEFRVSAHPQQPAGPLLRVASGGELSRVSLAIQVVASEVAAVPTLVFDEVDVGIGGRVAEVVGRLLQQLGARRQVICVTHLPQVAACADQHYQVVKGERADGVDTRVAVLDGMGRIAELARMMGGVRITAATRAHAEELLATSGRGRVQKARRSRSGSAAG